MNRQELEEYIKRSESPYDTIQNQLDRECLGFSLCKDAEKYDLSKMYPKVTYDDWIICLYSVNGKFYSLDEESIYEVVPTHCFEYDDRFVAHDGNGNEIDDDNLIDYYDCLKCGELDDMSLYVYFE